MALLTGNRFNPQLDQPPITYQTVCDPDKLLSYLKAQQQVITSLNAALAAVLNGISGVGLLADRPPAGNAGRSFYATDVSHLYWDNGTTTWVQIV